MRRFQFIILAVLATSASFCQTIADGQKMIYYNRLNGAAQLFQQIIKADSSELDAYYWLTQVLLEQKKFDESKALQNQLDAYIGSHPGLEKSLLDKVAEAEIDLHDRDSTRAAAIFDDVLKKTKEKDPVIMAAVVNAWLRTTSPDYNNLLNLLDKAEKKDKNNPEIFSLRGDLYRRLNNGGEAVKSYEQALKKDSHFAEADYKMGKIYLTQNNPELFVRYFNDAITADTAYAPAYYELYYYYYFRDVNKAKEYLDKYVANMDPSLENDYMVTDLYFASSKPREAIEHAIALINKEGDHVQPRLYKLVAYSYDQLNDSSKALDYLNQYFQKEVDSNYVAKDFELRGKLLMNIAGRETEAMQSFEKAFDMDTSRTNRLGYAVQMASLSKTMGDKKGEANWLGTVYQLKEDATNLDLYYWGLAHYAAAEYEKADSVFAIYTEKYPEHIQGFYWRAKSNALMDTTGENGLAIPYYQKVIEMGAADSIKNKSLLISAYGYIGAYEANVKKDFDVALEQFEKILDLEPGNADAMKYRDILRKWVKSKPD